MQIFKEKGFKGASTEVKSAEEQKCKKGRGFRAPARPPVAALLGASA